MKLNDTYKAAEDEYQFLKGAHTRSEARAWAYRTAARRAAVAMLDQAYKLHKRGKLTFEEYEGFRVVAVEVAPDGPWEGW